MQIASVDDPAATEFNITGLHPNRSYNFSVQPFGDTINGTKDNCPDESCRTKQGGIYLLIATMYL